MAVSDLESEAASTADSAAVWQKTLAVKFELSSKANVVSLPRCLNL